MDAVDRGADGLASADDGVLVGSVVEAQALVRVLADVGAQEGDLGDLRVLRGLLLLTGEVGIHVDLGGDVPLDQVAGLGAGGLDGLQIGTYEPHLRGLCDLGDAERGRIQRGGLGGAGAVRSVRQLDDGEHPGGTLGDLGLDDLGAGLGQRGREGIDKGRRVGLLLLGRNRLVQKESHGVSFRGLRVAPP